MVSSLRIRSNGNYKETRMCPATTYNGLMSEGHLISKIGQYLAKMDRPNNVTDSYAIACLRNPDCNTFDHEHRMGKLRLRSPNTSQEPLLLVDGHACAWTGDRRQRRHFQHR